MVKSFVISIVNIETNQVKYFKQFDTIGNVLTSDSVLDAFNFGVDISSARYVRNHVLREYKQTGESRLYHVNAMDVYLNQDGAL